MSAMAATSHTSRVLVDGTLAMVIHFEPKDRDQAMKLFGCPGSEMGVAALKAAAPEPAPVTPPATDRKKPPRMAPLCEAAVKFCESLDFQRWVAETALISGQFPVPWRCELTPKADAKACILAQCGIESRRELDGNEEAAELFHRLIRKPYAAWLARQPAMQEATA